MIVLNDNGFVGLRKNSPVQRDFHDVAESGNGCGCGECRRRLRD